MKTSDSPPNPFSESELQSVEPRRDDMQEKSHPKSKKVPRWLVAILILGGSAVLWQVIVPSSRPTAQTSTQETPPRAVEIGALMSGTGSRQVRLLGQVEAGARATLNPQIEGTVQQVLVREGDRVTPGMTMAVLDDADSKLALAEARARLAQEKGNLARLQVGTRPEILTQRRAELAAAEAREAEAQDNLGRTASLTEEGALSERTLVEVRSEANAATSEKFRVKALLAEAEAGPTREEIDAQKGLVAAAHAAVRQAELGMRRTRIQAAFPGVVESRDADPGDYVEVDDPILTLVSDRSLDIFLEIPESLSGQVAPGKTVNLTARALPDWKQQTSITAVVPSTDTTSRRQLVRVSLNNPPQRLLPGMAIQAYLSMPVENANTFVVPRDALTRRGSDWLLFTIRDNAAQQVNVEMVVDLGEEVIIANPELQEGREIVVNGGDGLTDNAAVKVVNSLTDR
ncbi:efflux RND transporter periplasmic adaptor subunit [Acaryochloris thomasi]|uniref:efflux RND transporter periplasmic adaptor subunit n=1 Tax=Acaryochloris thomasi TaxID=2929456 RepID=UPI00351D2AAE